MNLDKTPESRICPGCGTVNQLEALVKREYRCSQCNLEMAHLDMATNGVIRGMFGWLHGVGSTICERYQVAAILGKGGFGATYLVNDIRLSGKRRAIKEVPELLFDEYETSLLSRLNHPSIPDIIDRSEADGMVYLVLEFGGNKTLSSERKQHGGKIPFDTLLPWMQQLCEVLIYLHSQNPPIIHRDLKPDNILIDENGRIMLIDFGIAKESMPSTMTRTIGRAATVGFSPPEQAMGTGTDQRSDIYALSATFYALLTGENPPAAHERVAGKELLPPSQCVPGLPPSLESALLRALNLNVNLRQQTMQEFASTLSALEPVLRGAPTHYNTYDNDRTVFVGRKTHATGLHPPSLKIPSESASLVREKATKPPVLPQDSGTINPNKKSFALLSGIAVALIATMTGAYFLWPASNNQKDKVSTTPASQQVIAPAPEQIPDTSVNNVQPTHKPTPPPVVMVDPKTEPTAPLNSGGSAADAFKDELEKKGIHSDVKRPETHFTEKKKVKHIATATHSKSKPKPIYVQPKRPPTKKSNNDWLDEAIVIRRR